MHVPAVSPRELTGTTALKRGIPPGARGGIQLLGMVSALTAVFDVVAFSSAEKQELVALVQSRPSSNDDDDELSAPVVVACKSHSSNIEVVLSDLLDDIRHAESNAAHNFSMLQQSLEDQLSQLNRSLKKAKADVAEITTSLDA